MHKPRLSPAGYPGQCYRMYSHKKHEYQGCHSISISKFPDFSLTFNRFPDPFGRPILAIFIHRLFEDFAQIFELADLIFKEKL